MSRIEELKALAAKATKRFWEKVNKLPGDGCWEWTGCKSSRGYGQFWFDGRIELAHRMIYSIEQGQIPPGFEVCHKCDNRKCVRPDHMFLGTHLDNMRDCKAKGRIRSKQKCRLSESDVVEIVTRGRNGEPRKALAEEFGITRKYANSLIVGAKRDRITRAALARLEGER